jgi:hypothetical protein
MSTIYILDILSFDQKTEEPTHASQGCQIFLDTIYQTEGKMYQITTTLPNGHKIYQMTVKYYKWRYLILAFFILRSYEIYPNWDFGFENKPSGNPDASGKEAATWGHRGLIIDRPPEAKPVDRMKPTDT